MNLIKKIQSMFKNKVRKKRKVFCIGLHKTGTSTLHAMAEQQGLKATHSTNWAQDPGMLEKYDFFSDGGSHFDGQQEFDFISLSKKYPDALFILQTRDTKKWIISKLKHAGWGKDTLVEPDKEEKLKHQDWKYKSRLTIEKFMEHKFNYEEKVKKYFKKNAPERLLLLDITKKDTQQEEMEKLEKFLGWKHSKTVPHTNKANPNIELAPEVLEFIEKKISEKIAM